MKPFNLEEAKAGKPVCTRDGRDVRILCFDVKNENFPIIALVHNSIGNVEYDCSYTNDRFCVSSEHESIDDLMMKGEKKQGWLAIYRSRHNKDGRVGGTTHLFSSKEEVEILLRKMGVTDICEIKQIEWED